MVLNKKLQNEVIKYISDVFIICIIYPFKSNEHSKKVLEYNKLLS